MGTHWELGEHVWEPRAGGVGGGLYIKVFFFLAEQSSFGPTPSSALAAGHYNPDIGVYPGFPKGVMPLWPWHYPTPKSNQVVFYMHQKAMH